METYKELYYIVNIYFCYLGIIGDREVEKVVQKIFTTEDKAIEYLVKNQFVYGTPYPFRFAGWYRSDGGIPITRFLNADIRKVIVNDEHRDCGFLSYLRGKKDTDEQ